MKDPAFIFYSSDFLTGVSDLTMEERGQYITLLCLQHQTGHLSQKMIDLNVPNISDDVLKKFKKDREKMYFNERLEFEIEKRAKHIEHQRENGKKGGRPKKAKQNPNESQTKPNQKPLENENEIVIESINENINEIINYLNLKTNSNYKTTTTKTRDLIKARMSEQFDLDNFKTVIDKKSNEWLGTEFEKYLRPETLFGTKFESYLNQPIKKKELSDLSFEEIERMIECEKQNS